MNHTAGWLAHCATTASTTRRPRGPRRSTLAIGTSMATVSAKAASHCQTSCIGVEHRTTRRRVESALTGIYANAYIRGVESAFAILAEPNRRAILSLLASSERSVGDIERQLRMSQPSVSKHLRVLREAASSSRAWRRSGASTASGPSRCMEVDAWLAPFRRFWSRHVDALERHLDRMDSPREQKKGKNHEQP